MRHHNSRINKGERLNYLKEIVLKETEKDVKNWILDKIDYTHVNEDGKKTERKRTL